VRLPVEGRRRKAPASDEEQNAGTTKITRADAFRDAISEMRRERGSRVIRREENPNELENDVTRRDRRAKIREELST